MDRESNTNLSSRSATPNTGDAPQDGAKAGPALESATAQGALPEPSVEEIATQIDCGIRPDLESLELLCASWRERGEALEKARRDIKWFKNLPLMGFKATIKDKP